MKTIIDTYSPIALFVYNRLDHTQKTIEALLKNKEVKHTDLYVFSDYPANKSAEHAVAEVRAFIKTIIGFKSITIIERPNNYGLASSIIDGVSYVVNKHGTVIVLEDDLVTSEYFLRFMNDGLKIYKNDFQVASIHGYNYPVKDKLPETFFLRGADCWGWATWKRAWNIFQRDGSLLLKEILERNLQYNFDFEGAYPFTKMLKDQIAGKNDSWAIRWHASAFLLNMLTLYPCKSLVNNIGMDGSGTHCSASNSFSNLVFNERIPVKKIPLMENLSAHEAIRNFHKDSRKFRRIKFIINKIFQALERIRNFL
jgi:hypothetical protein